MTQDGSDKPAAPGEEKKPLIEYPTDYVFKVMGKVSSGDTLDFAEHVRQLFERKMESEVSPKSIQVQPSSKGNYISLSVAVFLLSEEQRRAIYEALHEDSRIVYYL